MKPWAVHFLLFSVVVALTPANPASAAGPVAPDPAQRAVAERLIAASNSGRVLYDEHGNVVRLALGRIPPEEVAKGGKLARGVDDAMFADILQLPHLEGIFLEMQPLSDAGYALLGRLKKLKDVRIHYPIGADAPASYASPTPATDRFAQFLNELPGLHALQLKHIFTVPGDGMAGIKPQPELVHLELDTICAGPSAIPFLKSLPRLENLQLHRTSLSDAQLQDVARHWRTLQVLELKPDRKLPPTNYITGRSLRALEPCRNLRFLVLGWDWKEMPFENGLDALTRMPSVRQLSIGEIGIKGFGSDSAAVQALHRARPELLLIVKGQRLGGQPGQKAENVDDGWTWGGNASMGRPFVQTP